MEQMFKLILEKFDAMDQKISAMDQKINNMNDKFEKRFEQIDKRFEQIDMRFEQIDMRFEQIDKRFDKIEAEQTRQSDLLHQLINTVAATNVKLSETNERIDTLETKVDSIILDIQEIKQTMATKKDLEYYDQMISEHSREIYKLKNR